MLNIRKATIASIAILVLIIGIAIASFATNTGTITKEAKLRKSASNDSIVLEIIPKKEEVEVIGTEGDWYQVKYNKIKGYVQKDYIAVKQEEPVNNEIQNTVTNNNVDTTNKELKDGDTLVLDDETKLYIRPLINSISIATLEKGKSVVVIEGIANGWAYVNIDGKTGWIRLNSSNTNNNVQNDGNPEDTNKKEELNKTAYIISTGINFREEPNTDSKVLKVFAENAKITILEEQGEWYKIKHNDQIGYVIKTYVSEKKVTTTSRSSVDRNTENKTTTQTKSEVESTSTQTTNSSKGQEVANYAKQFVGCRYVYGGSSPKGFDCSGLTMYVYKKFGVSLSHSATAQSKVGTKVSRANLQPGDLVFFSDYRTKKGIGHVGIYIGNNKFVHASTERTGVITSSLSGSHSSRYVTATRFF